MIECIFSLDYELYGNGEGSLLEHVYEPARRLQSLFASKAAPFAIFVEVAELAKIEEAATDPAIGAVLEQVRDLHRQGAEICLHLHPQWCNARFLGDCWELDAAEYNLCRLPDHRIEEILVDSLAYLRNVLDDPDFTPLVFRAGNWLLQPTATVASVLARHGIRVDSSVFKGGLQRHHQLDYRPACRNGYYWNFKDDVNVSDPEGLMVEIPTHAVIVPFWKMITAKRLSIDRGSSRPSTVEEPSHKWHRLLDRLRLRYPLKFDYCRMTADELFWIIDRAIREDEKSPEVYRPLVAIGHTKDLREIESVERLLDHLAGKGIPVTTYRRVYDRLCGGAIAEGRERRPAS